MERTESRAKPPGREKEHGISAPPSHTLPRSPAGACQGPNLGGGLSKSPQAGQAQPQCTLVAL